MQIDWKQLAKEVGALNHEGEETGSRQLASAAISRLIGDEALRDAVDHYIAAAPGFALVRSVLWQLRPTEAMFYCYEIYHSQRRIEEKRLAVELLRVVADRPAVPWIAEFLNDPDETIQNCGIGVLDQLISSDLVDEEEVSSLFELGAQHPNTYVKETIESIRTYLVDSKERERVLLAHFGSPEA